MGHLPPAALPLYPSGIYFPPVELTLEYRLRHAAMIRNTGGMIWPKRYRRDDSALIRLTGCDTGSGRHPRVMFLRGEPYTFGAVTALMWISDSMSRPVE